MANLITQSIGIVGAPLANAPLNAQLHRASQASNQAGVQRQQNAVRALSSATQVQERHDRSIQEEARVEGTFEDEANSKDRENDGSGKPKDGKKRIDKIV